MSLLHVLHSQGWKGRFLAHEVKMSPVKSFVCYWGLLACAAGSERLGLSVSFASRWEQTGNFSLSWQHKGSALNCHCTVFLSCRSPVLVPLRRDNKELIWTARMGLDRGQREAVILQVHHNMLIAHDVFLCESLLARKAVCSSFRLHSTSSFSFKPCSVPDLLVLCAEVLTGTCTMTPTQ